MILLEAVTNALYLLAELPSLDGSARQFLTIEQAELAKIRQVLGGHFKTDWIRAKAPTRSGMFFD